VVSALVARRARALPSQARTPGRVAEALDDARSMPIEGGRLDALGCIAIGFPGDERLVPAREFIALVDMRGGLPMTAHMAARVARILPGAFTPRSRVPGLGNRCPSAVANVSRGAGPRGQRPCCARPGIQGHGHRCLKTSRTVCGCCRCGGRVSRKVVLTLPGCQRPGCWTLLQSLSRYSLRTTTSAGTQAGRFRRWLE